MANYTVDPATGILIPTVGVDPGPDYATNVSNALSKLANLTHTGISNLDGYQIPSAGLNINADLSFQSNNANALRAVRFTSNASTLSGSGDLDCVYVKSNDLYYNNGSGSAVQLTSGNALASSATNNWITTTTTTNLTINSSATTILVSCDSTSGAIVVTLPLASAVPTGRFYIIKDRTGQAHTNNITINPAGVDTLDGASSYVLSMPYGAVAFASNGSNGWLVFSYDKTLYRTGESVTFEAGSTLDVAGKLAIDGRVTAAGTIVDNTNTPYTVSTSGNTSVYFCFTGTSAVTINLPSAASAPAGSILIIKDAQGNGGTNNISIVPNGTDNIEGLNATKKITSNWGSITLISASVFANNYWVML